MSIYIRFSCQNVIVLVYRLIRGGSKREKHNLYNFLNDLVKMILTRMG